MECLQSFMILAGMSSCVFLLFIYDIYYHENKILFYRKVLSQTNPCICVGYSEKVSKCSPLFFTFSGSLIKTICKVLISCLGVIADLNLCLKKVS